MTVGRYDDALRHLTEMRDLAGPLDNPWLAAVSRVYLGTLAVVQGRPEEAREPMEEGLELSLAAHSTRGVTLCLTAFARLAFVEGDPERAALLAGAVDGLRRRVGLRPWPLLRQDEAELVAQIRQALGDRFDEPYAAGSRLSQQEAVAAVRAGAPGRRALTHRLTVHPARERLARSGCVHAPCAPPPARTPRSSARCTAGCCGDPGPPRLRSPPVPPARHRPAPPQSGADQRAGRDFRLCRAWSDRGVLEVDDRPPAREATVNDIGGPLLVAEGVRKVYRTGEVEVTALRGLDLQVRAGELVAVMGPSGSGKTTLLNCLSGLDDIDAGRVLVGGRDLFAMRDADRTEHRARSMGFVFQSFNLIPVFTAAENIELPLLLVGTDRREARERALAMLARVGLTGRDRHRPNELSGGEQQRVTIARALVARPAIVWADEPTGNLDTAMAAQVMDLLRQLNAEQGQTIVLVTHDPSIGAAAHRLVRMRDGMLESDERVGTAVGVR